jgi:hypothetical protein
MESSIPAAITSEAIELKVFYFVDGQTANFGDDLNRWLWSRLLGCSLEVDDGTLLLGIGTVISQALIPAAKKYIVLSSGVGYNAPQQALEDQSGRYFRFVAH